MAFTLRKYMFSIFMLLWQVRSIVLTCPELCECTNNITSCFSCSYSISLKENVMEHQLQVCCNNIDMPRFDVIQKNNNKTFTKVIVQYTQRCNTNIVDLNFPDLNTFSISLTNNSISNLRINLKFNKVREIDLSYNKLKYVNKDMFGNFMNLRILILRKNDITEILKDSFKGLNKLETLDLAENYLIILTNVFTPLKNLQHLNISKNKLEFLGENYFDNWLLQHLDVSYNNLRTIAPGALQQLPNLARLLLTDNPHLGITQLDTQLLVGTGRRLQQIDASRTGLYQVPEAFTHSVRFLSLIGNNITSIRRGDLDSYPLLQSLDFSDNKISSVEEDSLGRLEMLIFLNINDNYLSVVPKSLPDELKYLSINNNLIRNLSIPDFKDLPNLRILLVKNNRINYIENHVFDDLLSLEILDLSSNPIQHLSTSTFDGPLSLRDLRLCYINISMPEKDGSFPLSSPESVQMLHLQASPGLARLLLADSAALAAFSHLQYLDIRMNNISSIRSDLLFYFVQLKTLRLHGNRLNCNNETWLNDWMNWNRSSSHDETCYYSTSDAKQEITKYNCTFPETFTISDSLPPVNLYSTEMINKLLRYYGYLNNKTDKAATKLNSNRKSSIQNKKENMKVVANSLSMFVNEESKYKPQLNEPSIETKKNQIFIDLTNKSAVDSVKEEENVRKNQINANYRSLDIESYRSRDETKDYASNTLDMKIKNVQGEELNETVAIKQHQLSDFKSVKTGSLNKTQLEVNPNNKLEYSPYQSKHSHYAKYIGTLSVSLLALLALLLWASLRLRFKRNQVQESSTDKEDQIEVSNISGGVLW